MDKFSAKYKYRKMGTSAWATTSHSGSLKSQSETLVMQKLRSKHKDREIELIDLKWK